MPISTYTDGVGDALRSIGDYATGLVTPTVRLGVTGLARLGHHPVDHLLHWSRWRRRRQHQARTSHYKRRGHIP